MDKIRCAWLNGNALYEKYHDEEWGKPIYEDKIFQSLDVEGSNKESYEGISGPVELNPPHDPSIKISTDVLLKIIEQKKKNQEDASELIKLIGSHLIGLSESQKNLTKNIM